MPSDTKAFWLLLGICVLAVALAAIVRMSSTPIVPSAPDPVVVPQVLPTPEPSQTVPGLHIDSSSAH